MTPRAGTALALLLAVLGGWLVVTGTGTATAAGGDDLPQLTADRRVYDQSGRSLSADQTTALQRRLVTLRSRYGADVVVLVRDLDATPEETFDQVEELQQAWVRATGTEQDTAGAILVNREPGTDDEARAGLFVGSTYDDGDIPRREQEDLVAETLIPPLRDGDVDAGLNDSIDRISRDIRLGPPQRATVAPSLAWTLVGLILLGYAAMLTVFALRPRRRAPLPGPTTRRPDDSLPPAVGAALTEQVSGWYATPATILALATHRALLLEAVPGPPGSTKKERTRVRLLDASAARDDVQRTVWRQLERHSEDGVVEDRGLRKVAASPRHVRKAVRAELRRHGWRGRHVVLARVVLATVFVCSSVLAIVCLALASETGAPLVWVAMVLASPLALGGAATPVFYPALSAEGRDLGQGWRAYRSGLAQADASSVAEMGVDTVLPDIVALGIPATALLDEVADRETGAVLAALAPATPGAVSGWASFHRTFAHSGSSGGGGGGFSGGGAGGGGGAAGST